MYLLMLWDLSRDSDFLKPPYHPKLRERAASVSELRVVQVQGLGLKAWDAGANLTA